MLTDNKIKTAKPADKAYKLADQGGLYIEVTPAGSKLWRYKFRIFGKESRLALGAYPEVSLAEARKAHEEARKLVDKGLSPVVQKRADKAIAAASAANTFRAVAGEWLKKKKVGWAEHTYTQATKFLEANAYGIIGEMPLTEIKPAHVLGILEKVSGRGAASVAQTLRQLMGGVFRYGIVTLRCEIDPTAPLRGAVSRPKTKHAKAMTPGDIKRLAGEIERFGGFATTRIALQLLVLTFVRTSELRKAEWSEFDLDAATWRIPADRMKMKEQHIVPLSKQAVSLLRELQELTGGKKHLFPNMRRPSTCMSATTINRVLERMGMGCNGGDGFSGHAFRATAATLLSEAGFDELIIDRQLAHAERNKVKASYFHGKYLAERAELMQAWADMVDGFAKGGGNVVPLKKAA